MMRGIGPAYAKRLMKSSGENPYRLARDIRGIGFKTADQIAAKVGIAKDAMLRVRAGVGYALSEAMDGGHCGLPQKDLLHTGTELLEVTADRLAAALALELSEGTVVADTLGERRWGCRPLHGGVDRNQQACLQILERLVSLIVAGRGRPHHRSEGLLSTQPGL